MRTDRAVDVVLLVILALSAGLGAWQLDWGLPNGNLSWAADALGPVTVLGIVRRSVGAWNSGWFYFKYPLGYPLVLLAVYSPYLVLQVLSGDFRDPRGAYPYGFADPERALFVLALLGRVLSVAAITATVALTYGIGRRLCDRVAALFAAGFAATAYPFVYYAHTTNLDAMYVFWLILALWSAVVVAQESGRVWAWALLGVSAAMAVSTKEQGFAFLLPLPVLAVAGVLRPHGGTRLGWRAALGGMWNRGPLTMAAAAIGTALVANNVLLNPAGFVRRILYLGGRQVPGVSARLAPVEFGLFKGVAKEREYVGQLLDALESSVGWPLLAVAAVGALWLVWRRRPAAAVLLLPALVHYCVSLRTLDLITLRYTLPLLVVAAVCAGAVCADAVRSSWRRTALVPVVCLSLFGLARAVEVDLLLRDDSRYQAEAWLASHAPPSSTVEIYQKPTYLPRLAGLTVRAVPLPQRTVAGLAQRHPDFIVVSSASKRSITHRWNPDWREGRALLVGEPGAVEFLRALEGGALAYRPVATFRQTPRLLRLRINSLCPQITVFARG